MTESVNYRGRPKKSVNYGGRRENLFTDSSTIGAIAAPSIEENNREFQLCPIL